MRSKEALSLRKPQVGDKVRNNFDGGTWMSSVYGNIERFNQGYWEVIEYAGGKNTRSDVKHRY